ncbi:polysaccharide pyruvyl transferase family protein [Demequina sp. SYSU T00192]|uniref:Polysaccharide pyruvyl transferase family protein n=1 Tax=Demequina litoralis TaxID=3051660 RepID=A0ABT8G840_9MICO|nr:polysaccharide pyruvyl transferase family protein [Demequina sp. SYSU T00192]MDN4475162.1 polysaccharide pyruvyl transferase family protein [Demequina sp. SYSU T00192]
MSRSKAGTQAPARVVIGRFHDGSATPNWGGRATSMALAGLVARSAGVPDVVPLNGTFNTVPFEHGSVPPLPRSDDPSIRFRAVRDTAAAIIASPLDGPQRELLDTLAGADELWMNGEGDPILARKRTTLARTLLIMEIALQLGIRVRMLNSILSIPPGMEQAHPVVVAALRDVLSRCDSVVYRDPESLELHGSLFPGIAADWVPDALFAWAEVPVQPRVPFGPDSEGLSPATARFLADPAPYIAVSGASGPRAADEDRIAALELLVRGLRSEGFRVLLVATDRIDDWLATALHLEGTAYIDPGVPLATGRAALAGASAFVSGRYHPSILAYGAGVPCVLMSSNSHKTRSLQRVMAVDAREHPAFGKGDVSALVADAVAAGRSSARARRALRRRARANAEAVATRFAALGRAGA